AHRTDARTAARTRRSREHASYRGADVIELGIGEGQPGGEIQSLTRDAIRDGIVLAAEESKLVQRGLFMHAEEERARLHALVLQPARELLGVHAGRGVEDDGVHPVDGAGPWLL